MVRSVLRPLPLRLLRPGLLDPLRLVLLLNLEVLLRRWDRGDLPDRAADMSTDKVRSNL